MGHPVSKQIYFTKSHLATPSTYTFKFSIGDIATGGDLLTNKVWEEEKSKYLTYFFAASFIRA